MDACSARSAVRVGISGFPAMKRLLLLSVLALGAALVAESSASAQFIPPGIGHTPGRVGRLRGYWVNPTRGHLYDYSSYFATLYPYTPGAQEYQWQPTGQQGSFGTSVAVLPTSPPPTRTGPPPLAPATKPDALTPAPAAGPAAPGITPAPGRPMILTPRR